MTLSLKFPRWVIEVHGGEFGFRRNVHIHRSTLHQNSNLTDLRELRSVATTLTWLDVPQPKDSHPPGVVEA